MPSAVCMGRTDQNICSSGVETVFPLGIDRKGAHHRTHFEDCSICYTAEEILGISTSEKRPFLRQVENKMRRLARAWPVHPASTPDPFREGAMSGGMMIVDEKIGAGNCARRLASKHKQGCRRCANRWPGWVKCALFFPALPSMSRRLSY